MAAAHSKSVVYAAVAGNLLVALTKFAAAWWTGASAMLSKAIHSVVDTGNQGLLLYGLRQAKKPPDTSHPLGYGRELYFWSFMVALLVFTVGAGVAFYEGVSHIVHLNAMIDAHVNYIVYGCSILFEGTTWIYALTAFALARASKGLLIGEPARPGLRDRAGARDSRTASGSDRDLRQAAGDGDTADFAWPLSRTSEKA